MVSEFEKYIYRVTWSEENENFIGLCTEFPTLSRSAESSEKALKSIRDLVCKVVDEMKMNHEKIPAPISTRKFSGSFKVRVAPETHRQLTVEAYEAGISMNRIVNAKLAQ